MEPRLSQGRSRLHMDVLSGPTCFLDISLRSKGVGAPEIFLTHAAALRSRCASFPSHAVRSEQRYHFLTTLNVGVGPLDSLMNAIALVRSFREHIAGLQISQGRARTTRRR